jgi:hypothetical protein
MSSMRWTGFINVQGFSITGIRDLDDHDEEDYVVSTGWGIDVMDGTSIRSAWTLSYVMYHTS